MERYCLVSEQQFVTAAVTFANDGGKLMLSPEPLRGGEMLKVGIVQRLTATQRQYLHAKLRMELTQAAEDRIAFCSRH